MHVFQNQLMQDNKVLGTFSAHWPACAAMIRFHNPNFKSLGGDRPEDLAEEKRIRDKIFIEGIDEWNKEERIRWNKENPHG